ncbi:MAG: serine protease [Desulfarculus sp.]|jgi:hypothetical protein|nr:MAG: serine protease [Desulfarculus sp.]
MSKFSKKPSFRETGLHSLITEFALPLTAVKDREYFPSGTAIVIGPFFAITAKHVFEDYWGRYHQKLLDSGKFEGSFSVQAVQIVQGNQGLLWNVNRIWLSPFTDIAFIQLTPGSALAVQHKWRCPRINLLPPPPGSRIVGFGYHSSKIKIEEDSETVTVEWHDVPTTTVGQVIEIHETRRDERRLKFPCFRTNARFDGGMSGGPVFNDDGELCGLICSSMSFPDDGGHHTSYATTLWPAMGTMIDMDRVGFEQGQEYPVLELAKLGHITAAGWESIILVRGEASEIKTVGLRKNMSRMG